MASSIAIAAADGVEPEERSRLVDKIAEDSQPKRELLAKPSKERAGAHSRRHASVSSHAPRGPPDDDLEERIGSKLIFTVTDLAALADRSAATIFRLMRLGSLPYVQLGGSRCFTRATVLNFLRHGTSDKIRRVA
jgi:hypothetical protein